MKTIKPAFRIEERDEQRGGLAIITKAGRICYKSDAPQSSGLSRVGRQGDLESRMDSNFAEDSAKGSPEDFVRGLIKRGHNSVLEHGDMIFEIADHHIYEAVAEALQIIRDSGEQPPMLEMTRIGGRCIISGNIRAWRELFAIGSLAGAYFIGHFDPVYVQGYGFADEGVEPDPRVRQIYYSDLQERGEKMAHLRQSVRFTVDRGVSHEFVRHRTMSFSQESTRFCNYSRDRFGHEITVIEPCFLKPETEARGVWWRAVMGSEVSYFTLLNLGLLPQEARSVLNNSTKTELMMTGNLRAWNHFFDLRARQVTGAAHPQAVEVAVPLYECDRLLYPGLIE